MQTAMENRVSRRSYVNKPIDKQVQKEIIRLTDEINGASGLSALFVEDGSRAFDSLKKSYGMFKNVRSLVAMKGSRQDEHLQEKVGYYGQQLILDLTNMGLGTCWVGGTYDEQNIINLAEGEELVCVIVLGLVEEEPTTKEKFIRAIVHRNVKPIEQRLTTDRQAPPWVLEGMEAVLLAPSAIHAQNVMFKYQNETISASTVEKSRFDLIDLGIAKKHFELGAGGRFEWGNGMAFHKD